MAPMRLTRLSKRQNKERQSTGMTLAADDTSTAKATHRSATAAAEPKRRCIVSRQPRPRHGLIRFVLDPDHNVVPDFAETLPGRGYWLSADRDIVEKALKTNAFAKAARGPATVPDGLLATLEATLTARCLHWLGLARGAGQLEIGFFQVKESLARGKVAVLIEASDGAENGKAKLAGLARELEVIDWFTASQLGESVGRDHLVHLALMPGKLGERFLADAQRYAGLIGSRQHGAGGEQ